MSAWVLILTIVTSHGPGGASSMVTHDFNTKESCLAAAQFWLNETVKIPSPNNTFSAICVPVPLVKL